MTDARWDDVDDDVAQAVRHLTQSLALAQAGGFDGEDLEAYRNQMALMHSLQSAHSSVEAALKRVLRILEEELPTGEDWHRTLISRLSRPLTGDLERPALLDAETAADLQETRAFRNRVAHLYGSLDIGRAKPTLEAAERLVVSLPARFASFKAAMDGATGRVEPCGAAPVELGPANSRFLR